MIKLADGQAACQTQIESKHWCCKEIVNANTIHSLWRSKAPDIDALAATALAFCDAPHMRAAQYPCLRSDAYLLQCHLCYYKSASFPATQHIADAAVPSTPLQHPMARIWWPHPHRLGSV